MAGWLALPICLASVGNVATGFIVSASCHAILSTRSEGMRRAGSVASAQVLRYSASTRTANKIEGNRRHHLTIRRGSDYYTDDDEDIITPSESPGVPVVYPDDYNDAEYGYLDVKDVNNTVHLDHPGWYDSTMRSLRMQIEGIDFGAGEEEEEDDGDDAEEGEEYGDDEDADGDELMLGSSEEGLEGQQGWVEVDEDDVPGSGIEWEEGMDWVPAIQHIENPEYYEDSMRKIRSVLDMKTDEELEADGMLPVEDDDGGYNDEADEDHDGIVFPPPRGRGFIPGPYLLPQGMPLTGERDEDYLVKVAPCDAIITGIVDPEKKALIENALSKIGATAELVDTTDDIFTFRYDSDVRVRHGVESFARFFIEQDYPDVKDVKFLTNRQRDARDKYDVGSGKNDGMNKVQEVSLVDRQA